MPKFKSGDKVKVVKASFPSYWYSKNIGEIFTLKDYDGMTFSWPIQEGWGRYVHECDIELVTPAPKTESEIQAEINRLQNQLDDLRNPKISVTLDKRHWEVVCKCLAEYGYYSLETLVKDQLGENK